MKYTTNLEKVLVVRLLYQYLNDLDMMMILKSLVKQIILGPGVDNNELREQIDNIRKYLEDKRYFSIACHILHPIHF